MRLVGVLLKRLGGLRSGGKLCVAAFSTGTTPRRAEEKNIVRSPFSDVNIPDISIPEYIFQKIHQWKDLPAVVCGLTGRTYQYSEVRERSQNFAGSLLGSGFKPGQVFTSVLPNTPEFPLISLGLLEAGMSFSPINFLYTPDEMAHQMKDCGSVGVVTIPERVGAVLEAKEKLTSLNRELGERLKVVVTPSLLGEEPELPGGAVSYTQLSTQKLSTKLPAIDTEGIALIPYSSGTTGLPKGVCLTHKNIVSNLVQLTHEDITDFNLKDSTSDVVPVILPMFHIYGLVIIAMQVFSCGSKLITLPRFEPTFFLNIMKEQKATVLFAAPPILLYLGASPDVTKEHLAHLRLTVSGAAAIAKSDIEGCIAKSPETNIYKQGYGLTECSPGVSYSPNNYKDYNSVGVPVPNTAMKVVDVVTREALPANQNGEICVRGPQVMKGYLNNPKATAACIDKDGWFYTGDTGYYTKEGYFYLVDRVKELIKVKGFQVAPAELEEVLRSHPAIKDAGVIGIEDKRTGERPIAFVSLHSKKNQPKEEELKEFIKEKVAPYKRIENFIFIDNIERSPAGKVLRKNLKQLYLEMQNKS